MTYQVRTPHPIPTTTEAIPTPSAPSHIHIPTTPITMNPYEARPDKISSTDRYAVVPLYKRYSPNPTNFTPDTQHVNSTTPESIQYWSTVLQRCTESNRIYENQDGGRDVFAQGGVTVKSSYLKETLGGRKSHRDYSYADANEVEAISLARQVLGSVRVPQVYFAAKVHVQIRTPKRENFASLDLPEETLRGILFWNDSYEGM
jgi:hypothetical protein